MRKYKYIWLPALLAIYFLFMTFYFGTDLLRTGETTRFWITVVAELTVLAALAFFLKRRERLRMEREKDMRDSSHRNHTKP
ncbi:MAG: hypothetical protein K2I92_05255 [Muribaculaceae bacterium]|nr:hypothetical protein [Muribaculaceae bacterium]